MFDRFICGYSHNFDIRVLARPTGRKQPGVVHKGSLRFCARSCCRSSSACTRESVHRVRVRARVRASMLDTPTPLPPRPRGTGRRPPHYIVYSPRAMHRLLACLCVRCPLSPSPSLLHCLSPSFSLSAPCCCMHTEIPCDYQLTDNFRRIYVH